MFMSVFCALATIANTNNLPLLRLLSPLPLPSVLVGHFTGAHHADYSIRFTGGPVHSTE
jgi:hypothetical protein